MYICYINYYMVGIYKIVNIKNGKCYIGSSTNIDIRIKDHFKLLRLKSHKNKYLQNSYDKYGRDSFIIEILEECSYENLLIREQYYIDEFWNNSYNLAKQAYSGGSNILEVPLVLLDLDGNVIDRYKSGQELSRDFGDNRCVPYNTINTSSIFRKTYRIVTLNFFKNNKDIIYSWKNFEEIYNKVC